MQTVTVTVLRDPASCWKRFTDASLLLAWVPGLRRAQVISTARGLPEEIHFEFSDSLAYTLVYTYDVEARELRWEPKLGRRDGVAGFAKFVETAGGTEVTYGLEQGSGRSAHDRALGDIKKIVDAFAAWMVARG